MLTCDLIAIQIKTIHQAWVGSSTNSYGFFREFIRFGIVLAHPAGPCQEFTFPLAPLLVLTQIYSTGSYDWVLEINYTVNVEWSQLRPE